MCVYERAFDGQEMDKRCLMLFMQKYDPHNSQSESERGKERQRETESQREIEINRERERGTER